MAGAAYPIASLLVCAALLGCAGDDDDAQPESRRTSTTEDAGLGQYEIWQVYTSDLAEASAESRQRFRRIGSGNPADTEGFARWLIASGRLHERFADDLAKLEPPDSEADEHEVYLRTVRRAADAYRAAGTLGLSDPDPAETAATVRRLRRLLTEARATDRATARARKTLNDELLRGTGL